MKRRDFLKATSAMLAASLDTGSSRAEASRALAGSTASASLDPENLRCEYSRDPLGVETEEPRLQWILVSKRPQERNQKQSAYQVLAATTLARLEAGEGDLWSSGRVDSGQSIQVRYGGKPLRSRQSVWWKVRVWDQDGRSSSWSQPATWSMGLLQPGDWTGNWIGEDGGEGVPEEFSEASWISSTPEDASTLYFRQAFEVSATNPASYGLLAALGSGKIAVFINGAAVTSYPRRLEHRYAIQDVTPLIHPGRNIIAVKTEPGASQAALLAGLTLDLADGQIRHIQTNSGWKVSGSAPTGWKKPDFVDESWAQASSVPALPIPSSGGERTRLPARMLRKEFHLPGSPREAKAYVSGLGHHELFINGRKVGSDVLAPGLTDYDKRAYYMVHDVTRLLRPGANVLGILLGNGRFYAPRRDIPTYTRTFGFPKVLLQLEIENESGAVTRIQTDATWKITTKGPIRANNHYDGEEYDARMEQTGWASPGYNDAGWAAARIVDPPKGLLISQMSAPIRVMRELKPLKITEPSQGIYIFDMGQNMVGWCRLRVSGPAGTRVALRHAEALRTNGMLYTDNLRSARQKDVYVLKGENSEVYEPRFTSHGFRYVELRGFPGVPSVSTLTGCVVHDLLEENPDFTTSDAVINHVFQNTVWGDRGNYQSIPTDCPQRDERQGWLGDRSAESMGESFVFDVSRFYSKWMQDMEDSMNSRGVINDLAPAYWPFYNENVVWPASFFIVADMLYRQYGDERVLRKHYPAMKRWMEHMYSFIKGDLMPIDVYGDWCVPPKNRKLIHSRNPATATAHEVIGSTYFYYLLTLMSRFSEVTGHRGDQQRFDALASKMKAAFNRKYLKPELNQYDNGTQTSSVLALALGLAPPEHRPGIYGALVHKIETETNGHLETGLVGCQWLMQTLAAGSRPDVACQIASQTTYPSWGYMIRHTATTIWELWDGDTANPAMNSRNHLMLMGDFCTWLYEDLAGIQSDREHPGFKHILIHPKIGHALKFVRTSHDSPHGKIATAWSRDGKALSLRVTIPPNTTATVYVPASSPRVVKENGKAAETSTGVRFQRVEPGITIFEIGSGTYSFASTI